MITSLQRLTLQILWPAFLAAGVLEVLLFAVVDPSDLHGLHAAPLGWSRQAVYTVTFGLCWMATAASSALTVLLTARHATQPGPAGQPGEKRVP